MDAVERRAAALVLRRVVEERRNGLVLRAAILKDQAADLEEVGDIRHGGRLACLRRVELRGQGHGIGEAGHTFVSRSCGATVPEAAGRMRPALSSGRNACETRAVTHEYTVLHGGLVLPGDGVPAVRAIAWAADAVLAMGTDEEVRAISRGDSRFVDLAGRVVIPLAPDVPPSWPTPATLEVGGPASLAILETDPRRGGEGASPLQPVAVVRNGRLVSGSFPRRPEAGPAREP